MKLRDSLAQNHSIRLQAESQAPGKKPLRSASICWSLLMWWNRAITRPFSTAWRSLALFCTCPRSCDATWPPGRGSQENGFCSGDAEKAAGI
ncbi:Uncharacterised protein [Salmonella bongori]|nr:Uncharacterised protein [Salmonella bongori]